jgi:hypothetical protein
MNDMMNQGDMMGMADKQELMEHLQNHIKYPATKQTIVESCNQMDHVPAATRSWAEEHIPNGTFKSADEVVMRMGL